MWTKEKKTVSSIILYIFNLAFSFVSIFLWNKTQNISAHQAVASLMFVFQDRINKLVHIRKRNQWVQQLVCHRSHLESCLFCQGNKMLVILSCNMWELWECLVIWHFVIFYPNIPRLIMSHNYTVSVAPQSFDPLILHTVFFPFLSQVCRLKTLLNIQYSINQAEVRFNIISR